MGTTENLLRMLPETLPDIPGYPLRVLPETSCRFSKWPRESSKIACGLLQQEPQEEDKLETKISKINIFLLPPSSSTREREGWGFVHAQSTFTCGQLLLLFLKTIHNPTFLREVELTGVISDRLFKHLNSEEDQLVINRKEAKIKKHFRMVL